MLILFCAEVKGYVQKSATCLRLSFADPRVNSIVSSDIGSAGVEISVDAGSTFPNREFTG